MLTYLLVNLCSILIPFIFSFHKRSSFYKSWTAVWPSIIIVGTFFIVWDVLFTKWGVWGFNPDYLIGIYCFGLPIEEWLFFICIPYACIFTYFSINFYVNKDYLAPYVRGIALILAALLLIIALLDLSRLYTSITFVLTGFFLLFHVYGFRSSYLGRFFLSYLVVFALPFLIVNGVLTGSFVEEPVVWYNNQENLSIRIFTIPIEDFIYGMLLFLGNITIYEAIISHQNIPKEQK
jgi:lycopene cyclase domain-containing protein